MKNQMSKAHGMYGGVQCFGGDTCRKWSTFKIQTHMKE